MHPFFVFSNVLYYTQTKKTSELCTLFVENTSKYCYQAVTLIHVDEHSVVVDVDVDVGGWVVSGCEDSPLSVYASVIMHG